jgi:tape measure domain-containing protein
VASRRLQVVLELDTGRYSGRLSAAGSQLKVFSGSVHSTSASVKKLQGSFDTLGNHMATPMQKLRDYVLILGNIRLAILNVRDIAVGWVGSMLKQSAEVQRLTILMKGLSQATTELGKNKEAEENLARLFDMARANGFAVKELADAYVKLKTAGIDPMDGSLQSLTDAVAKFGGNSDVMHRASIAIQQMAGKGVVSMEELRQQLGEAVPTAMWDMARAAGMGLKEFTKIVSQGKVQAKPALQLMFQEFERMYSGSGAALADTMIGQIEQFKTNVTQLSTSFTGMASGQTDALRGFMQEQRQLLADGKITAAQFEAATNDGGGAGMFEGATSALKQLNAAMRSNEAIVGMQSLGNAINKVMQALISAGGFVVRWRTEIVGAILGVAAAWTAMKAINIGRWFFDIGAAAVTSTRQILNGVTPLPGVMESWKRSLEGVNESTTRALNIQQLRINRLRSEITTQNAASASAATRVAQLTLERAAIEANVLALRRQVDATALTIETGMASGVWRDAATGQITNETKALNANAIACNRLAAAERLLGATSQQLAAAQAEEALAANGATAAQGRLNVSLAAGTLGARAAAMASGLAATAVTWLGRAVNIALGPIGMIAIALYAAASAAGVFENRANRAAAAAARLRQGMADVDAMEEVNKRNEYLKDRYKANAQELNRGYTEVTERDAYGGVTTRRIPISERRRQELMNERAGIQKEFNSNNQALQRGDYALRTQEVSNAYGAISDKKNDFFNRLDTQYRTGVTNGTINEKNSAAAATRLNQQKLGFFENQIGQLDQHRAAMLKANPHADTRKIDALIGQLHEEKEAFVSLHAPVDQLRKDMIGAGKATGGAHHKLTDAEKAAKKAATAFENAREKYAKMIDQQEGEIGSLEERAAGGDKTGEARFEALKKAGFYADATNEELEKLKANFVKIDELNSQITFEHSLGSLQKEMAKTAAEATSLWTSLRAGTYEAEQRDAQYRSRFANLLEGLDPEKDKDKIARINADIQTTIDNIKQADAAEITKGWIDSAQEIENGLQAENIARQRNFDLEVARQRQLIELTKAGTQERIDAEAAFARWHSARQLQLQRENESGVLKMSRDWAKLGTNIDGVFTSALGDMVNMLDGGEVKLGEFVENVLKSLFKVILQAIIAYGILSAIGQTNGQSFSQFMRGGVQQFMGGFAPQGAVGAPTKHTGGMIGGSGGAMAMVGAHLWNNAQTRHDGGWIGGRKLKKGEVPIVGLEKELVLTEEQQRLLGQQLSGRSASAGTPNVQVNVINNSGQDVDAEVGTEFNGTDMIISVVLDALGKQGRLRDAVGAVAKSK